MFSLDFHISVEIIIEFRQVLMRPTKFECLTVWCYFKKVIISSQKSG